jgi:hypothetical protein
MKLTTRPRHRARSLRHVALGAAVLASVAVPFATATASSSSPSPRAAPHLLGVVPTAKSAQSSIPRRGTPFLGVGNLTYHGGPVMHTNTTYAIYWIPSGFSVSSPYESTINGFFQNVATASGSSSNVYASDTQYSDGSGNITYSSTFAGSYVDTTPFPSGSCDYSGYGSRYSAISACVTDADIQAEVDNVLGKTGWRPSSTSIFFVFTPKDVGSCLDSSSTECAFTYYCAYHSDYIGGYGHTYYANQPYTDTSDTEPGVCDSGNAPNGDQASDSTINVVSHEHNETITDQQGNAWYDAAGYENGDKCAWIFGTPLGGSPGSQYNQVIGSGRYYLQEEWSNASSSCVLTYGSGGGGGAPTISSFSPTSGPRGTQVTITGTNFASVSSVQMTNGTRSVNAAYTVNSATQITATVPSSAPIGASLEWKVTTSGGSVTSTGAFKITSGGGGGGGSAPTISGFSPTSGPVGTKVVITGTNFTNVTSVQVVKGTLSKTASFTVDSSTQITATVPSVPSGNSVSWRVTTTAGSATSAGTFTVT